MKRFKVRSKFVVLYVIDFSPNIHVVSWTIDVQGRHAT